MSNKSYVGDLEFKYLLENLDSSIESLEDITKLIKIIKRHLPKQYEIVILEYNENGELI